MKKLLYKLKCFYKYKILRRSDFRLPHAIRVSSKTLASEIVSVQPMAAPTGQLFYLDLIGKLKQPLDIIQDYYTDKNGKPQKTKPIIIDSAPEEKTTR